MIFPFEKVRANSDSARVSRRSGERLLGFISSCPPAWKARGFWFRSPGFRGLGLSMEGWGLRVSGFGVQDVKVRDEGFRVQGSGIRIACFPVQGSGFKVASLGGGGGFGLGVGGPNHGDEDEGGAPREPQVLPHHHLPPPTLQIQNANAQNAQHECSKCSKRMFRMNAQHTTTCHHSREAHHL